MTEKTISPVPEPEKLARRKFLGLASAALFTPVLVGCTLRSETIRYKLTLSLNTPDGVKTGSVVNEVTRSEVYGFPHGWAYPSHQRGQALFVDMGKGRKPLIALLAERCLKSIYPFCIGEQKWKRESGAYWKGEGPIGILEERPGSVPSDVGYWIASMSKWKTDHAHVDISPEELPELVTFADINDQSTVELVNPFDLEKTYGPEVSWHSMTVDVVDEQPVFDLDSKLPLLKRLREIQSQKHGSIGLDGSEYGYGMASGKASLLNYIRLSDLEVGVN